MSLLAYQRKTQELDREDQELHLECGIDWTHSIIWHNARDEIRSKLKSGLLMSAFDCGPTTYYDYPGRKIVPVDNGVFTEMMRFAQATPEIGYTSTWYRQDVPPQIERIESLAMGARITDKLDGIEAIFPEVVKYLAEASTILTGRAGDSSYLAGSECVTPPMIMESRLMRRHARATQVRCAPLPYRLHARSRDEYPCVGRRIDRDGGCRDPRQAKWQRGVLIPSQISAGE